MLPLRRVFTMPVFTWLGVATAQGSVTMLCVILLAQGDVAMGAGAGWSAFGLAGLILAWLFFKHLPDKDTQIKDMIKDKDAHVISIVDKHDSHCKELITTFKSEIQTERTHCDANVDRVLAQHEKMMEQMVANHNVTIQAIQSVDKAVVLHDKLAHRIAENLNVKAGD